MLPYLLLVCVSLLAGYGLLSASGVRLAASQRWYLSPGACLVAWSVAIGIGVSAGLPVRDLAIPLWLATGAAAVYGFRRARHEWTAEVAVPLAAVIVMPIGLLAYDFIQGLASYIGGPAGDGWSYVAYGQYLWEVPRGTEGSLSPLHQYATHLSRVPRFISDALLGLFSPLTGAAGDTQASAGLFVAWALFVFGASCAGCGVIADRGRRWVVLFCLLAVSSRWVYGAVEVHNYDNLLALSFLPFAVGIITGIDRPTPRSAVLLGVTAAGCLYAYPEMAPVVFFGLGLAMLTRAMADGAWTTWMWSGVAIAVLAIVLLLPAWKDVAWFTSNQLSAASATVTNRPGEGTFPEVLNVRDWTAAFWGYGPAAASGRLRAAWGVGRHLLGAVCWMLALIGAAHLTARRRWDVVVLTGALTAGALYMVVHERYSYGAYKLLLVASWAPAALVVSGAQAVAARATRGRAPETLTALRVLGAVAGTALAGAVVAAAGAREASFRGTLTADSIEPFRTLLNIDRVLTPEPILAVVDDPLANQWAVYFLREHQVRVVGYRGYMAQPHVVPSMERARAVDLASVRYVLSDTAVLNRRQSSERPDVVWADGPYSLWRVPPGGAVVVNSVDNPNGNERLDGLSFYWIGQGDTTITMMATADGDAVLSARFTRGPSLPDSPARRLAVSANGGDPQVVVLDRDGDASWPVRVRQGENRLVLRSLDRPTAVSPNDPRPLLVGMAGVDVRMAVPRAVQPPTASTTTSTCSAAFISGWHPREPTGDGWLQWSSGTGRLRVASKETADFELDGELLSFTRPNTVEVRVNGRKVTTWVADDPSWGPHAFTPVPFHVEAGRSTVIELRSATKPVVQPVDHRPLAMALKDVIVKRTDRPAVCADSQEAVP